MTNIQLAWWQLVLAALVLAKLADMDGGDGAFFWRAMCAFAFIRILILAFRKEQP